MPCDCIFANVFTVFVTVTFVLHIYSLASPCWVCNGTDCKPRGIYDACASGGSKINDMGPFVLAIIILISNAALMVIFCIKVRLSFLPAMSIFTFVLVIWFLIQEVVFGAIIFSILFNQYDNVGWAAYLFFIPGLVMVFTLLIILGLFICVAKAVCSCCDNCCCDAGEKAI